MKSIAYGMSTLLFALTTFSLQAQTDWSHSATLPGTSYCEMHGQHEVCYSTENRANIYNLDQQQLEQTIYNGGKHVLYYPVDITPLQIPMSAMEQFFNEKTSSPIKKFFFKIAKKLSQFKTMNDVYTWLGLHEYPEELDTNSPNPIPNMGDIEQDPMGATIYNGNSPGMTFSCAACHSGNLFGTKVLGLTNRFPRANEFFHLGQRVLKNTPEFAYRIMFRPDQDHLALFRNSKNAIMSVGVKKPKVLGLDTSLAQVGLSLAKRVLDEYATPSRQYQKRPRANQLNIDPADSKPAVWWNLKYKTRWLSDGSIISGNPVYTNFLWNEIGRGVDLKKLENWLMNNQKTVKELTSYVFAATAPKYNDFFPKKINIETAKKGQKLFLKNCSVCHGKYDKGWDDESLSYEQKISTTKVHYHTKTPVIDVGTDPYRYQGMRYFAKDLNRLKISKTLGTVVKAQKGYVPPPLVGIWARWPYFHNNSIPTLYDVITPDYDRPITYIAVASDDKEQDFDQIKNGYPAPEFIRPEYKNNSKYLYNTKIKGLSNSGHTKMLLDENGVEKFSHEEKLQIIEFLKTL